VIGSERKIGGGEVHIGFDTIKPIKRGGTGIYKMLLHRDREGHFNRGHFLDLHVTSDPDTHQLTCEFKPVEHPDDGTELLPTTLMERVSGYLEKQDEPVSRNQILLNVKGNDHYIKAAIDHLTHLDYITETAGPNRSRLFQTTRPFITSEWESKENPQVRPSSAQVRSTEPPSGSASSAPPIGADRTGAPNGRPPVRPTQPDDPEAQAMLEQYGLTDPPYDDIPF
jgi:hypothetical protein